MHLISSLAYLPIHCIYHCIDFWLQCRELVYFVVGRDNTKLTSTISWDQTSSLQRIHAIVLDHKQLWTGIFCCWSWQYQTDIKVSMRSDTFITANARDRPKSQATLMFVQKFIKANKGSMSPFNAGFHSQRSSDRDSISTLWRHLVCGRYPVIFCTGTIAPEWVPDGALVLMLI